MLVSNSFNFNYLEFQIFKNLYTQCQMYLTKAFENIHKNGQTLAQGLVKALTHPTTNQPFTLTPTYNMNQLPFRKILYLYL